MSHDVFLSYSRKDQAAAERVRAALERRGLRVWIDRSILGGADWANEIVEAIHGAKVMVLIFSANANASDHVRREVERAVSKGLTLIPFRIENVEPKQAFELFLSSPQWVDGFSGSLDKPLERLCSAVRAALEASRPIPRPSISTQDRRASSAGLSLSAVAEEGGSGAQPFTRKLALVVLGCAALGAVLALTLFHNSPPGSSSDGGGGQQKPGDSTTIVEGASNSSAKTADLSHNCYESVEDCSSFYNTPPLKGALTFDSGMLKIEGVWIEIEGAPRVSAIWLSRLVEKLDTSKTTVRCDKVQSGRYVCVTDKTHQNIADILANISTSKH